MTVSFFVILMFFLESRRLYGCIRNINGDNGVIHGFWLIRVLYISGDAGILAKEKTCKVLRLHCFNES